jgi:hypothetical protein
MPGRAFGVARSRRRAIVTACGSAVATASLAPARCARRIEERGAVREPSGARAIAAGGLAAGPSAGGFDLRDAGQHVDSFTSSGSTSVTRAAPPYDVPHVVARRQTHGSRIAIGSRGRSLDRRGTTARGGSALRGKDACMALGPKGKAILALIALLICVGGFFAVKLWWYRGYSMGSRTGIVRKVSVKGPPYCKYLSAEMTLQSTGLAQAEIWEFSVDDISDANPLVKQLKEAERTGDRVTINYRQDLEQWYRCSPSEYYAVGVEK